MYAIAFTGVNFLLYNRRDLIRPATDRSKFQRLKSFLQLQGQTKNQLLNRIISNDFIQNSLTWTQLCRERSAQAYFIICMYSFFANVYVDSVMF
jgi:hypothetical protein